MKCTLCNKHDFPDVVVGSGVSISIVAKPHILKAYNQILCIVVKILKKVRKRIRLWWVRKTLNARCARSCNRDAYLIYNTMEISELELL